MKQVGICSDCPQSGKTTCSRSSCRAPARPLGRLARDQVGVVRVPDDRIDRLAALFQPKKTTLHADPVRRQRRRPGTAAQAAARAPTCSPACATATRWWPWCATSRTRRSRRRGVDPDARSARPRGRTDPQRPGDRRDPDRAHREGTADRQEAGRARARAAGALRDGARVRTAAARRVFDADEDRSSCAASNFFRGSRCWWCTTRTIARPAPLPARRAGRAGRGAAALTSSGRSWRCPPRSAPRSAPRWGSKRTGCRS